MPRGASASEPSVDPTVPLCRAPGPAGAAGGALALAAAALPALGAAFAQSPPDPAWPDLRPELQSYQCKPRDDRPEPTTEAERVRYEVRARYAGFLPLFLARVGDTMPQALLMPVEGVSVSEVAATFGAARAGNRQHDGVDIFAPRGTPVRAAAPGFVYRIDDVSLGGLTVTVVGDGGVRYFYTHFEAVAEDLVEGQRVETDTLLGYVGNSGNAAGTPTHLHFGVYVGTEDDLCDWRAVDPLPRLVDRE
jgi:murein DD-endopeptidase MepM/ murein hydrolase activator NlpD